MILAVTTQQGLGLAVAGLMVVGWLVYLFAVVRRRPGELPGTEIELAPNRRPYYDDEALEGPRLERALGWALLTLAVASVGLPMYWLREPGRQAGAVKAFDDQAVNRGYSLFLETNSPEHGDHFGCANCHGPVSDGGVRRPDDEAATGGVARFTVSDFLGANRSVDWSAPALNTALLRFSKAEVRRILVYGRPNTPMPAWGIEGGGPMNDQQIDDLVAFLGSITPGLDDSMDQDDVEAYLRSVTDKELVAKREEAGASYDEGRALFELYCARCHTKGFSYGEPEIAGGGAFGPNLRGGVTLRQFPDASEHASFVANGSDFEKPYGIRGVGSGRMPGFGARTQDDKPILGLLTDEQIAKIVAYERSLQ